MIDGLEDGFLEEIAPAYSDLIDAAVAGNVPFPSKTVGLTPGEDYDLFPLKPTTAAAEFEKAFAAKLGKYLVAFILASVAQVFDEAQSELETAEAIDEDALAAYVIADLANQITAATAEVIRLTGGDPSALASINIADSTVNADWKSVAPERAIEFWKARTAVTSKQFDKLSDAASRYAFTIAGQEKQAVIDAARSGIEQALTEGKTFRDFRKGINAAAQKAGVDPLNFWHAKTVYRQNVLTSYAAGRFSAQQSPAVTKYLPYLIYQSQKDGRERPTHGRLHGVCLPAKDNFWNSYYPPWDWNCRCYARSKRKAPKGSQSDPTSIVRPPITEAFGEGSPLQYWKGAAQVATGKPGD